jgi:hypothetical protein
LHPAGSADTHPALTAAARVVLRQMFSEPSSASLVNCGGRASWLRAQLATLTRCAKRENLPAEQFLLAIEQAWRTLPQLRSSLIDESDKVFALVVTLCLEEYCAQAQPPAARRRIAARPAGAFRPLRLQ